jgi:Na+/pantothenate symporter
VVTSYTLAGGFKSVVLTDAVQGVLMVVGAVAMIVAVVVMGGGPSAVFRDLQAQDPALVSWSGKQPLTAVLSYSLAVGLKYLVEPRQLSRFYGLRDTSALRLASVIAPLIVLVTYLCLLPVGALAHALIPAGEIDSSDRIVPYLLRTVQLFGPVMSSLFLVVLLSAAMSSIDSVLLVTASAIDHDLVKPDGTGERAVRRTRIWVVVVSLCTTAAAINPFTEDIVAITSLSGSLYGACFLPALVVGLFWRRASAAAALASIACGCAAVVGWYAARRLAWTAWHEVYVGVAVGLAVFVIVSWLRPDKARVVE